ncbi:MAG: RNA-dependent ATPase rok1, partial [Thelocarpon impressellum]
MDIFKLLSRSTNLPRSSSKQRVTATPTLPSAGQAANPQLFRDDAGGSRQDRADTSAIGKKRKRGRDGDEKANLPAELDFFGDRPGGGGFEITDEAETDRVAEEAHIDEGGPVVEDGGDLDDEECRRVLNAHKLKVTLLATSESSAQKWRAKETSKKQRKHAARLYPQPLTSFDQLRTRYGISRRLAENIGREGYRVPTEVQIGSLPLLLRRRSEREERKVDLLTVAPTGSGKTIAYMIATLDGLLRERHEGKGEHRVRALIVAPTKELAAQIVNEGRKLAAGTGLKVAGMHKGMAVGEGPRRDELDGGEAGPKGQVKTDVLVTTPLMLLHALEEDGSVKALPGLSHLVLDEADVLLDPLFREQTLGIWKACTNPDLRVSLWSATIGSSVECLAADTISSRRSALPRSPKAWQLVRLVVGLKDSAVPNISHRLVYTATEPGKLLALRQLLHPTARAGPPLRPPFLVFTQTIPRAQALYAELLYDISPQAGGPARLAVLHAALSDAARADTMARFRAGAIWILITTDLLARGLDLRGLNAVVNYDAPSSAAAYVHRVGRTGRAGREGGVAVTLYTKEDVASVRDVAAAIAASERVARQNGGKTAGGAAGVEEWLLAALPKPSKKQRAETKRRGGVAARREGGEGARRARISTKSG